MITLVAFLFTHAMPTAHAADIASVKGWHATRSIEIDAAPEFAYHYISDFQTWPSWTAWNAEMDPAATWSYSGTPGEPGHTSTWTGPTMGDGTMSITAAEPNATLTYDLFFDNKPKANPGQFTLTAQGDHTTVTWDSAGQMGFFGRLFFAKKVEKMIGADFEKGLANLKLLSENDAREAAKAKAVAAAKAKAAKFEASAAGADADAAKAKEAAAAAKTAEDAANTALAAAKKKDKAAAQAAADAAKQARIDAEAAAKAAAVKAVEARKAADEAQAEVAKAEAGN